LKELPLWHVIQLKYFIAVNQGNQESSASLFKNIAGKAFLFNGNLSSKTKKASHNAKP